MNTRRNHRLHWDKKAAVSGAWSMYVQAANEEEVRWMHAQDLTSTAQGAGRYPGPFTVEMLPLGLIPPARDGAGEQETSPEISQEQAVSPREVRGIMRNQIRSSSLAETNGAPSFGD